MRVVTLVGAFAVAMTVAMAVAHVGNGSEEAAVDGPDMTVNGTADNNIRDGFLTLREAMLLATGGLPVSGLAEGECNQISGAQWTPPNPPFPSLCISGLVPGASSADTITFDPIVFNPATITIGSQLPWLSTGGDAIDGATADVTVRATWTFGACIIVDSDDNIIKGVMISNCFTAVSIYGNDNLIGGTGEGERNVISDNANGIWIAGDGNRVRGNYIGTDASGTAALTNYGDGVHIDGGAMNVIGGSTPAERNVISGSGLRGVWVSDPTATGNVVKGNYIGTDVSGTVAIPNENGVLIGQNAHNNTIGGAAAGDGNVISGNPGAGVRIQDAGTAGNVVKGNYIGTNASGAAALPNGTGVLIRQGPQGNVVGGSTADERNVISGNSASGVRIALPNTTGNSVRGNYIGTNASATVALPNEDGVVIGQGAQSNTVGGNTAGDRNVISGNEFFGVSIGGLDTDGNIVRANYIGIDLSGTTALPNADSGVMIFGSAENNTVQENLISGNGETGVMISQAGSAGNVVKGNFIGTNASGAGALGNVIGVWIRDGAQTNTVGGSTAGARNVISGNSLGVWITGSDASSNVVKGNYIGTDASGNVKLGDFDAGVSIQSGASNNVIGGSSAGERNVISGNRYGVHISSNTDGNTVQGNYIGVDASGTAALGNQSGLFIGGTNTTVGGSSPGEGNIIAFSTGDGVTVDSAFSTGNTIRGNAIHSNGGKGIHNSDGGNTELPPPVITGLGSVEGTACANCTIDIYSDHQDEGAVYEGSTTADGTGNWSFPDWPQGPNSTATATDSAGNTSEFSVPVAVPDPTSTASASPTELPTPTPSSTASATPTPTATPVGQTTTPPPTATAGPSATATPPVGGTVIWGDANCSGSADPVDSLLTLRHDAGLSTNTGDCPELGTSVGISVASTLLWGDIDCSGGIDPVDSLKLLRFDAALSVSQGEGCPVLGVTVIVAET